MSSVGSSGFQLNTIPLLGPERILVSATALKRPDHYLAIPPRKAPQAEARLGEMEVNRLTTQVSRFILSHIVWMSQGRDGAQRYG